MSELINFKSYVLVLSIDRNKKIRVGSLGFINFKKGVYFYVGSAKKNFEKRVLRHQTKNKKVFWHIDYLTVLKEVRILNVYKFSSLSESEIAKYFLEDKNYQQIDGFGSSDCKCKSHLFMLKSN